MPLHPAIENCDINPIWKEDANRLLYSHPCSSKILYLLNNREHERRISINGDYPNCFGTAFWVMGLTEYGLPEYFPEEEVSPFLKAQGFRQIDEFDLPATSVNLALFTTHFQDSPLHGAVYLGKFNGTPLLFEQAGTGREFRIRPPFGHMFPKKYYSRQTE